MSVDGERLQSREDKALVGRNEIIKKYICKGQEKGKTVRATDDLE